jgi:hypothetical protein
MPNYRGTDLSCGQNQSKPPAGSSRTSCDGYGHDDIDCPLSISGYRHPKLSGRGHFWGQHRRRRVFTLFALLAIA